MRQFSYFTFLAGFMTGGGFACTLCGDNRGWIMFALGVITVLIIPKGA